MTTNTTITPTIEHARKIRDLCSHGLCRGLGEPRPGEMCVEAVVAYALGQQHTDEPSCVGEAVRRHKIKLNDCEWSSNAARAAGMRALAIAQLGSDTLDQAEFEKRLRDKSMSTILVYLVEQHFATTRDIALLPYLAKFKAALVFDGALWEEFYNNNYYNNYNYYYNNYNYYYYLGDAFLKVVADCILNVLKDMKSPGCEWLFVLDEPVTNL